MLYFIGWVLFLLVVLLAVPVAAMLEKRKYQALHGDPDPDPSMLEDGEAGTDEAVEFAEDDGFGGDPIPDDAGGEFGEAAFEAPGGDDFSAFDEEFK